MDVYYGDFNILYKDNCKIDFNIIGYPEVFTIATEGLYINAPICIGNIKLQDQVLYEKTEMDFMFYIYVMDNQVYGVNTVADFQYSPQSDQGVYSLELNHKSDVVSLKQTSPIGYSIFNNSGDILYTTNELISEEAEQKIIPYDLGLATIEYRYMQVGHVRYKNHHQYICYDLFRKEFIVTKKSIEVIYSDMAVNLDFSESETIIFNAAGKSGAVNIQRFPAGRARRILEPTKELMDKGQHIHSVIRIDESVYHIHNRISGVFMTKGYPTRVSGFKSSMIGFFGIQNLYLVGRNTHYAFQANGKYEKMYLGNEYVSTFVRPLKMKLFQRFGYFKIPIKKIKENNQPTENFHVGDDFPLHPMKIKTKTRKNINLDFKSKIGRAYTLKVDDSGNLAVDTVEQQKGSNIFKRIILIADQLVPTKLMVKIDKVKKRISLKLKTVVFNILGKLPKKKKLVVFESFHGKQYSDNPRAIYEYMKAEKPDFDLVWSIDPNSVKLFDSFQVPYIKRDTLKWLFTFPRANYWVSNARLPNWIMKPKDTVYLQTWHGTPLKKLGFDIEEIYMPGTNTEKYKDNFANESKNWDLLVSPNAYSTEIFKRAFRYDGDVVESGYPRNDALQNVSSGSINSIREKIGIPAEKKVILYAPTWRDDDFYKRGQYKFEFQFDLRRFKEQYGDNFVLLTRMHYLVAENFEFSRYEGFIYDVSNYPDIKDLYRISDLLITDYSSVFFDYSILNRPIIFFMYDLEKYRDQLRGFYFDIEEEAPGPIAETEDELFAAIDRTIDPSWQNPATFSTFQKKFTAWEDGQASKKVVAAMINASKENEK